MSVQMCEVVLANTHYVYVWPGGLECAQPPSLTQELRCHTADAKQSGGGGKIQERASGLTTVHKGEITNIQGWGKKNKERVVSKVGLRETHFLTELRFVETFGETLSESKVHINYYN